jgi:hypothetical protein
MGGMSGSSSSSSSSSASGFPGGGAVIVSPSGARQGGMAPSGVIITRPAGGTGGPPPVWASRFPSAGQVQGGQRPASITGPGGSDAVSRPSITMPLPGLNRPPGSTTTAPGGDAMPGGGRILGPIGPMRSPNGGLVGPSDLSSHRFTFRTTEVISPTSTGAQPPQIVRPVTREVRTDTIAAPDPLSVKTAVAHEPLSRAPVVAAATAAKAAIPKADPGRPIAKPSSRGLFGLAPRPISRATSSPPIAWRPTAG